MENQICFRLFFKKRLSVDSNPKSTQHTQPKSTQHTQPKSTLCVLCLVDGPINFGTASGDICHLANLTSDGRILLNPPPSFVQENTTSHQKQKEGSEPKEILLYSRILSLETPFKFLPKNRVTPMMIDDVVHHMHKYLNDLYIDMANPAMPKRYPTGPRLKVTNFFSMFMSNWESLTRTSGPRGKAPEHLDRTTLTHQEVLNDGKIMCGLRTVEVSPERKTYRFVLGLFAALGIKIIKGISLCLSASVV